MEFLVLLHTLFSGLLLKKIVLFESNNAILIPNENSISNNIFKKISLEPVKAFR